MRARVAGPIAAGREPRRRLFGLGSKTGDDPAGLRRLERLRAIDLSPASVGKPALLTLRSLPHGQGYLTINL